MGAVLTGQRLSDEDIWTSYRIPYGLSEHGFNHPGLYLSLSLSLSVSSAIATFGAAQKSNRSALGEEIRALPEVQFDQAAKAQKCPHAYGQANLRTKTLDFRGFDSSIISTFRAGILMCIGISRNFESANLVWIILVVRLGVAAAARPPREPGSQAVRQTVRLGRGDNTVANPHRAQLVQFELLFAYHVIKI